MKSLDLYRDLYPIAICNGYCGIGESDDNDHPYFYAKSFDGKQEIKFKPKYYFQYEPPLCNHDENTPLTSNDFPSDEDLTNNIKLFKNHPVLQKIVLAKKRTHAFKEDVSHQFILAKLIHHFPKENVFAYAANKHEIFFGSTPENLFSREGNQITVDCIAGTQTSENKKLLFTKKFIHEHLFVTDYVENCLKDLCDSYEVSELTTKKAAHLIHLYRQVTGKLPLNTTDDEIIKCLHPTPATLGTPKSQASEFLNIHEHFDREFYAGCLGWMHPNKTLLKVALRCGIYKNKTLTLFAGAGITKDSDPVDELNEINHKFNTLEEVFLEKILSN
ncbi:MAG: Isochorismate synthase MenF [Chlamydiia bacterium]|nr:Isochorismate synthase MenF [Chlamydiia bacterium]